VCLTNIAQEREIKLLPQTHSLEVVYSHFIMVAVLVMLEGLEKRPGTAPTSFPPPIFAGSASVSWLCVSLPPPHENTLGGLYIGDLKSTPSIRYQDGRHGSNEVQTRPGGAT
jgi:hypothetical protein